MVRTLLIITYVEWVEKKNRHDPGWKTTWGDTIMLH